MPAGSEKAEPKDELENRAAEPDPGNRGSMKQDEWIEAIRKKR